MFSYREQHLQLDFLAEISYTLQMLVIQELF